MSRRPHARRSVHVANGDATLVPRDDGSWEVMRGGVGLGHVRRLPPGQRVEGRTWEAAPAWNEGPRYYRTREQAVRKVLSP